MPPQTIKGAPATKLLISTASIAATIGGWAILASQPPAAPSTDAIQPTAEELVQANIQQPEWLLATPVIPQLPELATVDAIPQQKSGTIAQAKPATPAQIEPTQVDPTAVPAVPTAPAQVAPAAPALRQVSAPKPRTRSSR